MNVKRFKCRICASESTKDVIDLGMQPLADALVSAERLGEEEKTFPLRAVFCEGCGLMQIEETIPAEVLFDREYPYYSSFSDSLLEHSRKNAAELIRSRGLNQDSLVIEIASNDGYLLRNFIEMGVPCMGIDPAEGPALAALSAGVPTVKAFFTEKLAAEMSESGQKADVIIANNVLAHVSDTNGFVRGIGRLLKDGGIAVFEVPYAVDLVEKCEFDTIYHEHLCYFTVTSLKTLFEKNGLKLNDVRRIDIHGGSLRVFAGLNGAESSSVRKMLSNEARIGADHYWFYSDLSVRAANIRKSLRDALEEIKSRGGSIAAYGAAAKGSTLVNYAGVGPELVGFVADKNVHKQGKYMPGMKIPIMGPEALEKRRPDYLLILAWNFASEIISQLEWYWRSGGRFIIPIPEVRVQ